MLRGIIWLKKILLKLCQSKKCQTFTGIHRFLNPLLAAGSGLKSLKMNLKVKLLI